MLFPKQRHQTFGGGFSKLRQYHGPGWKLMVRSFEEPVRHWVPHSSVPVLVQSNVICQCAWNSHETEKISSAALEFQFQDGGETRAELARVSSNKHFDSSECGTQCGTSHQTNVPRVSARNFKHEQKQRTEDWQWRFGILTVWNAWITPLSVSRMGDVEIVAHGWIWEFCNLF